MEQSKIEAMMDGRTLTKENILNMYQMVQNASDAEEKKKEGTYKKFIQIREQAEGWRIQ